MFDISLFKQISIIDIAKRLGIQVHGTKAMCFMGHDKASPSLSFQKSKNTWRCFGVCGKSGDGIGLVMDVLNLDFKAAIEWLSHEFLILVPDGSYRSPHRTRRHNMLPRSSMPKLADEKEFIADPDLYGWIIKKCGNVSQPQGIDYLNSHGIPLDVATRFGVRELCNPKIALQKLIEKWSAERVYRSGVAFGKNGIPARLIWTSYTLLFPFYEHDLVTFIQGRLWDGNKKFMNPIGIAKPLFNINALMGLKAGSRIHICEGVPDAIALESEKLVAIGVPGAHSFRAEWVDLFLRFNVDVLGDNDTAGQTFQKKISELFAARGMAVRCIPVSGGKDVAEMIANMRRSK